MNGRARVVEAGGVQSNPESGLDALLTHKKDAQHDANPNYALSSNHPHAITLFAQIERIFLEALDCGERYTAHVVEAVCA